MRAYAYCRVSTQEQARDEHYSLANQEARCRDYLKHKSWHLVKVLRDIGSAKSAERDGYQELLGAIRSGQVDVIVTYRLDRLSRNVADVYDALDLFRENSAGYVSVQEAFDTTTAMGRAMPGVAAVFAQLTRGMISENTKDGLLRRAQSGKYVGSPHSRPYGYTLTDGLLALVPAEAAKVRRIFRLYTGSGWGAGRITDLLNRERVPTRDGLLGGWHPNTIVSILRNPLCAGSVRIRDQVFAGQHDPVISAELFGAAQELQAQRSTMAPREKGSRHLLSWLAECGQCGCNLITHQQSKGGHKYVSYRHKSLPSSRRCLSLHKSAPALEAVVAAEVRRLAQLPQMREAALPMARASLNKGALPLGQEREQLLARLAGGDAEFEKWAERLSRGQIDEDQFVLLNGKHLQEKHAIRERLQQVGKELAQTTGAELALSEVAQALDDFSAAWDTLSVDERREMLRSIVEYLRVYPEHAELKILCLPEVRLDLRF
jgi:DNA invertase Pin-like site-specific DNA recombinase